MHSSYPKVLHELAGVPLLGYVIAVAKSLVEKYGGRIRVVTGHGSDQVDPLVVEYGAEVVHQHEQLGTGHALQIAMEGLGSDGQTLVLYGDVPFKVGSNSGNSRKLPPHGVDVEKGGSSNNSQPKKPVGKYRP